jgi:hypothetical protein
MMIRHIPGILAIVLTIACGGKTSPPAGGTGGGGGPGSGGGGSGSGSDGAGQMCGTRGAAECPPEQFCNFEIGADCGATDKPGHCMKKPQLCPRIAAPVCGCDGKTYGNGCEAQSQGVGVKANGPC